MKNQTEKQLKGDQYRMKNIGIFMIVTLIASLLAFPVMASHQEVVSVPELIAPTNVLIPAKLGSEDFNGDGVVDDRDLKILLNAWGPCNGTLTCYDLNGDGIVGILDLLTLLTAWTSPEDPENIASISEEDRNRIKIANKLKSTSTFASDKTVVGSRHTISVTDSITSREVAEKSGFDKAIVEEDIKRIRPPTENGEPVSFPGKVLIFEAVPIDNDEIIRVIGYIGSLKKATIKDGKVEATTVVYRGRINLQIEGQKQVESYLIVEGSEVEYIYGLVPITNGNIVSNEPNAKLLLQPEKKEGALSFGFGDRGVVNLEIISFETKALRPGTLVATESVSKIDKKLSFWKRWFTNKGTIEEETEISVTELTGASGSASDLAKETKRPSLVEWLKKVFARDVQKEGRLKA